jgi:Tfp pilus assembly protein PilO
MVGARASARLRLNRLRGSRQRSILGLPEIVGLSAAGLLLVATVFSYFYFLLPARARLRQAGEDRTKLQNELRVSSEGFKESESTQASVEKILESLQSFESRNLVSREEAGTAVIEELNGLIRRNGLRISTGVAFTQFNESTPGSTVEQQRAAMSASTVRPIQSVFPGVGVNLTVEGGYANLRRFIRDVEADRRFIVINAVELEGVTDSSASRAAAAGLPAPLPNTPPGSAPGTPPAQRTTLVSLRLNMAAYFRRSNAGAL